MIPDKSAAVLALRLIAALAAKLANDLERGRLWEGELAEGAAKIAAALRDVREH
jgi:hypothetical protein